MRHRESAVSHPIKEEVKNEYSIDIKDEDLEDFGLELPIDVALEDEYEKSRDLDGDFCDNEDSLIGDSEFMPSSPRDSPIFNRRRRKPLQPQRNKHNFPLATFPKLINNYNDESADAPEDGDDSDDDSHNEFKDIEQELEEEMISNDENENVMMDNLINRSPDTEEYASQFSNDNEYPTADEEGDDEHNEPPDMETDDIFKGLREEAVGEAEELDEKTQKSVEEEWKAYWGVKCNMCKEVFTQKVQFDRHYRSSYNSKPIYTCSYCNKSMNTYSTFRSHCYRHIAEGRYKCPCCAKGFSLRSILKVHMLARHTDIKPFICEECGKGFVTKAGLNIHLRKHRTNQKEDFPCGECGKTLHTRGGLTAHMNVHRMGRRFMCDICGKTFTQKVNMQQHVKQHTGERPFTCDQCGKSFAEKSHLARHHSFHSNQRPFKCNVCDKMYKTERCLKVHRLVHAVSRPHVCSYCNKGFLSSTKLKQHHNIHTGERPFKCKYCERTFTNYPNWLKHTRRRHKVDHKTGVCLVPKQEIEPQTPQSQQSEPSDLTLSPPPPPLVPLEQPPPVPTELPALSDQLLLDYSKLVEHNQLLTTAVQLTEDSKMNMQTQLFPQFEVIANTSYANMSFMLPYQQHPTTALLEPHPAHQNQLLFQSAPAQEEPFPAHQQQMLYSADHMHFLHAQHLLQM